MRIQPPSLEIADDGGFTPELDILGRADFGRGLTNLVQTVADPLVILLDSPWGSGKTTFLRMWAGELRKEGHPVVYFDAFAHDHIGNAFLAIAGEVIGLAKARKGLRKTKVDKFVDVATKTGKILLVSGAKIAVKAATLGAIDATQLGEELSNVTADLADAASEKADEYVKGLLLRQAEEKATFESFRKALGELAAAMVPSVERSEGVDENESSPPLVFILDELDRCRPPFALDLLETIKHLFSVTNVHFVLSASLGQLEASVKYSYGAEIDASAYLQKFYNFSVTFPEVDEGRGQNARSRYIEYLKGKLPSLDAQSRETEAMIDTLSTLADIHQMSLRTIERILSVLSFSLAMTPKNHLKLGPILIGLCVLKVCHPDLFRKAKSGHLTMDDVEFVMKFDVWGKSKKYDAEFMRRWWFYCLASDLSNYPNVNWSEFGGSLFRYNVGDRTDLIHLMITTVVDRLKA